MAHRIQSLARLEGTPLNQTVLKLLRKGVSLAEASAGPDMVETSLDHLIGTWTQAEARELDSALEVFEMVDPAKWE